MENIFLNGERGNADAKSEEFNIVSETSVDVS